MSCCSTKYTRTSIRFKPSQQQQQQLPNWNWFREICNPLVDAVGVSKYREENIIQSIFHCSSSGVYVRAMKNIPTERFS